MKSFKTAFIVILAIILVGCSKDEKTPDVKTKLGIIENYSSGKFTSDYENYELVYNGKKKQHSLEELNDVAQKMRDNEINEIVITYHDDYIDNINLQIIDDNVFSLEVDGNEGRLSCEVNNLKKDCTFYKFDYDSVIQDYYKEFYETAKKGSLKNSNE